MKPSQELINKLTDNGWMPNLSPFFESSSWETIHKFLNSGAEYQPKRQEIFKPLGNMKVSDVKCVIIASEPYFKLGMANGFAFAVPASRGSTVEIRNIIKELEIDLEGYVKTGANDFTGWIQQGVLLINDSWITTGKTPNSLDWELLTNLVLKTIATSTKAAFIFLNDKPNQDRRIPMPERYHRLIINVSSPTNPEKGFYGSRIFSLTNGYLRKNGISPINWFAIDGRQLNNEVRLPKWSQRDEDLNYQMQWK